MPSGAGKNNANSLGRPRKAHFGPQQQQQQQLLLHQQQHQLHGDVEDADEFDGTGYQPPLRSNTSSSGDSGMMQHNNWKELHGRRQQQTQQQPQQQQQLGQGKVRGGNGDCGCNINMHTASQRLSKTQLPRYIPAHNIQEAFDAASVDQETNSTCSDAAQEFPHHQATSGNYEVSDESDGPDELEDESTRGSGGAATMAPTANNSYGGGRGLGSRQQQQHQQLQQQQQQQQQMKQQRRQQRTAPPLLPRRCHSDPTVSVPQQLYARSPIMHNTCKTPLSAQTSMNRRVHSDQTGSAQQVYNHSPGIMHGGNGKPPPIPQSIPTVCSGNGPRLPRQQKQQVIQQLVIQLVGCGDCPSCRRWHESSGPGGWQTQVQVLRSIHASCSGSVQLSQPTQQPVGHSAAASIVGGGAARNSMAGRRSIREHPQQQIE